MRGKNRKTRKAARSQSELSLDLLDQVTATDEEMAQSPPQLEAIPGGSDADPSPAMGPGDVGDAEDPVDPPPLKVVGEATPPAEEEPVPSSVTRSDPDSWTEDEEAAPRPPAVFEFDDPGTGRRSRFDSRPRRPPPRTASQNRTPSDAPVEVVLDETREIERLEAMADGSNDPGVLVELGQLYLAQGRYGDAEESLRRAQSLDPERGDVRTRLGILAFRRGLFVQAEADLRLACEEDPQDALAFLYRGEALNVLGRIDEAFEAVDTALRLNPEHSRTHYLMGILLDRKNRHQEAGTMYRRARELASR